MQTPNTERECCIKECLDKVFASLHKATLDEVSKAFILLGFES